MRGYLEKKSLIKNYLVLSNMFCFMVLRRKEFQMVRLDTNIWEFETILRIILWIPSSLNQLIFDSEEPNVWPA